MMSAMVRENRKTYNIMDEDNGNSDIPSQEANAEEDLPDISDTADIVEDWIDCTRQALVLRCVQFDNIV